MTHFSPNEKAWQMDDNSLLLIPTYRCIVCVLFRKVSNKTEKNKKEEQVKIEYVY